MHPSVVRKWITRVKVRVWLALIEKPHVLWVGDTDFCVR
jgi:hypothetical protein